MLREGHEEVQVRCQEVRRKMHSKVHGQVCSQELMKADRISSASGGGRERAAALCLLETYAGLAQRGAHLFGGLLGGQMPNNGATIRMTTRSTRKAAFIGSTTLILRRIGQGRLSMGTSICSPGASCGQEGSGRPAKSNFQSWRVNQRHPKHPTPSDHRLQCQRRSNFSFHRQQLGDGRQNAAQG